MTLFDAYVVVDWSASSVPKAGKDSVWVGVVERNRGDLRLKAPANPRTRADAASLLRLRLKEYVSMQARVFVGFDFPYGYPTGFSSASGRIGVVDPWRATWDHLAGAIRDDERNGSNRFAVASDLNAALGRSPGPFWGCPASRMTEVLRSTGCAYPYETPSGSSLARKRIAERRLRGVQETWKLYGNGSVGSQSLVGIPRVAALRGDPDLSSYSRVWPFETGFAERPSPERGPFVLHAEIWPGIVPLDATLHAVRDAAQVLTLARHLATLDDRLQLGAFFGPPQGLDSAGLAACTAEEGWILGA